jgi:hypothetical protein
MSGKNKERSFFNLETEDNLPAQGIGQVEEETEQEVASTEEASTVAEPQEQSTTEDNKTRTLQQMKEEMQRKLDAKRKQKTKEETHVRTTFLLDKELAKRLDRLSKKQGRGFKTDFLNDVIKEALDVWEA